MLVSLPVLSKSGLFDRIQSADIPKAVKCLKGFVKSFNDGDEIYTPATEDFTPGIVVNGNLKVCQHYSDGTVATLRTIEKGELFGISQLYESEKNTFIVSDEEASVLFLHLPSKEALSGCECGNCSTIIENISILLAKKNCLLSKRIDVITRPTLKEKLLFFFSTLDKDDDGLITLDMTREEIAEYIFAERSAVSRELGRMQDAGLLEISGKKVKLIKS